MQMAKDLNVTILLDVYGQLLTEKQRNAIDMYYNEDLSLSEIADVIDISRQGVRESIKQGEKQLKNYEEKAVHICTLYYYGSRNSRARICSGTSAME